MESNPLTSVLLPLALAIIMLGMGLGLTPTDFRRIGRHPKAITVGLFSQMVVLPLIGALIVWWLPLPPAIAVGLLVLAICPGGPSSNLITYLAKGDVALSVSLTALTSLFSVVTIPVLANLALRPVGLVQAPKISFKPSKISSSSSGEACPRHRPIRSTAKVRIWLIFTQERLAAGTRSTASSGEIPHVATDWSRQPQSRCQSVD